jgi:hypothetical protein
MTSSDVSLDVRLTEEVSLLSTKLVNAVLKQLELEEIVYHLRKDNNELTTKYESLQQIESKYDELLSQFKVKSEELTESKSIQAEVQKKNDELNSEVEDLTASLFDEANKMVSDASRETHNFKIKNRKLIEELDEKDNIILSLQLQLSDLKDMLLELLEAQTTSRKNTTSNEPHSDDVFNVPIYSPTIKSIRLDLNNYNHEFKAFIYAIIRPDFVFELSNLKNYRFFKKIWIDELETALSYVPAISQNGIFKNFQRGKNFWSSIVEGRAIIEPVKGANESFRLAYKGETHEGTSPVAVQDPCSTCGESRNDILEHSRLYYFKLLTDMETSEIIASFPLCNYCVVKLRNICEFFAKLRLIKKNIYKLKPNSSFDEFALVNQFGQFKINSGNTNQESVSSNLVNSNKKRIQLDVNEEAKLIKIYVLLILIRGKIFWSKMGVWYNFEDTDEVHVDEMKLQSFVEHAQSIVTDRTSTDSKRSSGATPSNGTTIEIGTPTKEDDESVVQKHGTTEDEVVAESEIVGDKKQKVEEPEVDLNVETGEGESDEKVIEQEDEKVTPEIFKDAESSADAIEKETEGTELAHESNENLEEADKDLQNQARHESRENQNNKELTTSQMVDGVETNTEANNGSEDAHENQAKEEIAVEETTLDQKADDAKLAKLAKKKELALKREAMKAKLAAESAQSNDAEKPKSRFMNSNTKSRVSELVRKVENKEAEEKRESVNTNKENDDQFVDASETNEAGLTRKKSKSKQFTKKMNDDLEDTLKMLKDSIAE